MFNTISSSLQHTIPPSIFSFKGFPHLHTITNHLISSLKDQDLKKMKELKDKIKSLPFDELTEEELLTPSLSTIIDAGLLDDEYASFIMQNCTVGNGNALTLAMENHYLIDAFKDKYLST